MQARECPTLARRGFLRGLSALPAAVAIAAPVAAAEAVSPEVAELSRLFDAARLRTLAAAAACEAADAKYVHPATPEALFQRSDEPLHRYVQARRGRGGRLWYGDLVCIEQLRDWPMEHPGWEAQHARRAEILAAYDAWSAAIEAAQDAAGVTAAGVEYTASWEEEERPVRERIVALRSTEPAALRLKVKAYIASIAPNDWRDDLDEGVKIAAEREGGPWQDTMAASILRDLVTAHAA